MSRRGFLLLAIGLSVIGAIAWRLRTHPAATPAASPPPATASAATYVGATTCAECHKDADTAWRSSQHSEAMLPASAASIKGRFDGAQFRYEALVSTFFQRDGRYWVRTDGPDGTLADFEVAYTFGVYPLQQYLIALPGGRMQALSIAWDTRPKSAGGQRWFHLQPGERITHGDELHWTGRQQNWNFMCADCHSTNVRKNYDAASDTFKTTWSEINVTCEACHGPGSQHVNWARQAPSPNGAGLANNGLTVQLTERRNITWTVDQSSSKPVRSSPRTTAAEIETCAQCHSRRAQIAAGYHPGAPLLDFYEPATLSPALYYPDGQQRDEVYTYGSFLQSRMAHAGVTCSDCHDPHSSKLRATGNALCVRCHTAARYDVPAHHHHQGTSAGASCVECHMPARTYMQIDPRRDHSLRVPRPDQTVSMGVPNACANCHANRPATWAASAVRGWLGRDATGLQRFAPAFQSGDERRPDALSALLNVATSSDTPAVVRASAFERLASIGTPVSGVAAGLRDADPLVRQRALRALDAVSPAERLASVLPLLSDPIRSVRLAAAHLVAISASTLTATDRTAFDRASAEVIAAARFNADRPESRVSLGVFFADQNRMAEAMSEFRAAIRVAPDFPAGYVNLSELLRSTSEADAERVIRDGLVRNSRSADLHYALGLSLTRSHRATDAASEFKLAASLAPENPRFPYAYALALNGTGQSAQAIDALISALSRHAGDHDILFALASLERDAGQLPAARQHAARLAQLFPGDPDARALVESVRDAAR